MDSVGRSVVTTLTTSTILVFSLKRVGWWRRRTTWQGKGEGGGWRIGQDVWSERRRPVGQGTPAKCTVPLSSCTESCLDICLDQLLDRDGEREREREREARTSMEPIHTQHLVPVSVASRYSCSASTPYTRRSYLYKHINQGSKEVGCDSLTDN